MWQAAWPFSHHCAFTPQLAPSSVWTLTDPVVHCPRPQLPSKIMCMHTVITQWKHLPTPISWPCSIPLLSAVTIHAYACSWAWPSCTCLHLATAAEYVTSLAGMSTAGIPTAFATQDRAVACCCEHCLLGWWNTKPHSRCGAAVCVYFLAISFYSKLQHASLWPNPPE